MSDDYTTEFYRPGKSSIEVGPVPGRKSHALGIGKHGSPSRQIVAYFRTPECAEDFKEAMRGLLEGLLIRDEDA